MKLELVLCYNFTTDLVTSSSFGQDGAIQKMCIKLLSMHPLSPPVLQWLLQHLQQQ